MPATRRWAAGSARSWRSCEAQPGSREQDGRIRHPFNPDDARELAKAERRFYELTNAGFTAAVRTGPGQVSRIRSFGPNTEETVDKEQFAKVIGVSLPQLYLMLRGDSNPSLLVVVEIARRLGIGMWVLLGVEPMQVE